MTGNWAKTVVIFGLLLTSAFGEGESESISCDNQYFAELGKPSVVACNASGEQLDVYWFKGRDTSSFPILTLEDGTYGGQEYQKGEYEFTNDISLKVNNTQLKQEGNYTVRIYFYDDDFATATTELKVYIRPDPPCPLIDACGSTCTGCQMNVTTSGSLTCYVSGSRPRMDVDWIVSNQSGVSFTKEEQTHREMDDRWYTEKTIQYTTPDCGADATFRCIASLSDFPFASLLDTYSSTVRINTEACTEPPSMEPTSSPKGPVTWLSVVIGIIIVFVVICAITIACCLYIRRCQDTTKETTPDPYTEMQTKHKKPKPKKTSLEERKNILVEGLVKYYEKFGFIKPLPWGEPIPIHALYTTCQCTITNVNGDVSHHTSDFLSTPEFNFDSDRVFIIADLGYGKTTHTQHLVSDWVSKMKLPKIGRKNQTSEPILLYVHLKEVDPSMTLSELVKKMMPAGIDLVVNDIIEIFLNFEFQVLLDGLDELSMSTVSANTSAENTTKKKEESENLLPKDVENDSKLTVANLLYNEINTFKFNKIKVWVTSRDVDNTKASFALPYSKVKLNGFSDHQVNEYINKTCKYYFKSQVMPQLTLIPESKRKDSKLDATQQAKLDAQNQEEIEIKTTNNESTPVIEGGCTYAENVKYENPMNREKNDTNINEVNEESKQTTEDSEQDKTEQTQTVDVEIRQNEEIIDEQIGSKNSFTEDANNEANESNIIADKVSDEVTTELIPAAHHEMKQRESEQKDIVPGNDVHTPEARNAIEILSKKVTECMELNEISHNFSETPLLLIMIIHIITCRMLDPTGKYKEVNVNKLTTIIRLVITCLESRYVQKVNNQSIQEDIKKLEASVGKIAFENKMSLSLGKRDYWNNKLGEKDTQLALAVGLLKYSKKVGSGGSQLEELAFSSYAGIMFYHEFFQEFLAAQYVPESDKEWAWIDEFIKKSTDDATVRLLQFMFGMNHARLDKAVKSLLKEQKMWNNLIDCIYEMSNLEKKQAIVNGIYYKGGNRPGSYMNINIQHLDRKHHRVALTDFCDACNASDVKPRRMTLREECAIDFIKYVTLPSLKFLIFLEMSINEDQFVSIITSLTNKKYPEILQFVKCSVPDELREEAKQTVESALKGLNMKIYNCKTISPATMSVPKFNTKKGNWRKELFPKEI